MATINDYLDHNKNRSFEDFAFNEADILCLNELGYFCFEELDASIDFSKEVNLHEVLMPYVTGEKLFNHSFLVTEERVKLLQKVVASKRFVVVGQENYDKFVDMVVKHFKSAKWGDPMDQATTLAPLSSAAAKEEVLGQIKLAKENGATVVYGDEPIDHPGNFVMPTVLINVTKENPIYNQEIFGPVASIYKVDTEEEAIALANDSSYGLGGTVFSKNLDHAKEVAAKIETGMSFINSGWTSHPEIPFGGVKNSGYGRELSELGFDAFVNEHLIFVPND